jgi:nicotinamide riboside transporter PnuC
MDYILIITTIAALFGAYLNSIGNATGFAIWIVTNMVFMANNWYIGQWQQALLFMCYLILASNGLRHSLKNKQTYI